MQTAVRCCKHCTLYTFCRSCSQLLVTTPKPRDHNRPNRPLNLWCLQLAPHFCSHQSSDGPNVKRNAARRCAFGAPVARGWKVCLHQIFIWAEHEAEDSAYCWSLRIWTDGRREWREDWFSEELQCSHRSMWNLQREPSLAIVLLSKTETLPTPV